MKKVGYLLLFVLLLIMTIKPWRQKALNLIFTGSTTQKGVTLEDLQKAKNKDLQSFSTENMKVTIHHISTFLPKTDAYKLKDANQEFVTITTSIENLSDGNIESSWFMATYFVEDENGKLYHNYLDQMTGYYQENPKEFNDETKALIDKYYDKILPAKTALAKKIFFFPMPKGAKVVKIYFDDPIKKEPKSFKLK